VGAPGTNGFFRLRFAQGRVAQLDLAPTLAAFASLEVCEIVIESATLVNDILFDCEKPFRTNEGRKRRT
jgi:hypothetical protein